MTLNLVTPIKAIARAPRHRVGIDVFPIEGNITCRACDAAETVALNHPALLCSLCLSDLSATARRVADEYAGTIQVFFDAGEALTRASLNNAWYAKTERARSTVEPAVFARAWATAKKEGGEKAMLINLRDNLDDAAETMRAAELRYINAVPELEAARAHAGEPIDV